MPLPPITHLTLRTGETCPCPPIEVDPHIESHTATVLLGGGKLWAGDWSVKLQSASSGAWEFHISHAESGLLVARCWLAYDAAGSDLLWPIVLATKPATDVPLRQPATLPWLGVDLKLQDAYRSGLELGDLFEMGYLEQSIAWALLRNHLRQISGGDALHIGPEVQRELAIRPSLGPEHGFLSPIPLAVGQKCPCPLSEEGMMAVLNPYGAAPSLTLVASILGLTRNQRRVLRGGPIQIGLLQSDSLVWIMFNSAAIGFDPPYGVGLAGATHAEAVKSSLKTVSDWPPAARGRVQLCVVDHSNGLVVGLRELSFSRDWWLALAEGVSDCPSDLTQAEYDSAMARDRRRWSGFHAMLSACQVIERGRAI